LLKSPVEDLGFVTFEVPNWQLLSGLGQGRFSSVFSCRSVHTQEVVVLKVFGGDQKQMEMAQTERNVLNLLNLGGVENIPLFKELHLGDSFWALILTPLGVPVLPRPILDDVTPAMFVTLLKVVQQVHSLGWIHRDIKPDNIYLEEGNTSRIVLNDWSSAVRVNEECDYVGTRLFGDLRGKMKTHIPEPSLDLRSLVKTVFCLSKQQLPAVEDDDTAVARHWDTVKQNYPTFRSAMDLADTANYKALVDLFANVW
jgi:serine/threonine protein kinase